MKFLKFSDEVYNALSWVGKLLLPSLATLYTALAKIWGLSFQAEIPATIMALDVFLNVILGISSVQYYKETYQNTDEQ